MAILIQIREECRDCDEGQVYGIGAVMRDCPSCKGKGYTERYAYLSEIKDMLKEIKERNKGVNQCPT